MSSRLVYHMKGLFFDYRRTITHFKNQYDNNADWKSIENWFVFIQLEPKLCCYDEIEYDGHEVRRWTLLGISVGCGYSWDSKRLADCM